jgi:asparagine synthase (glutamine-hydrolysing)
MCGIWAILGELSSIDLNANLRAFFSMQSRGPDASRVEYGKHYMVGFHRLSINDLTFNGQQPFIQCYDGDHYIMICNGEIYNAERIKEKYNLETTSSSDCAVILPLFRHLKYDFIALNKILHGEYALTIIKTSIVGTSPMSFWASTDPLSVRPLFVASNDNHTIAFSSLLQGLTMIKGDISRLGQGCFIQGTYETGNLVKVQGKYAQHFSYSPDCSSFAYCLETTDLYQKIVDTLFKCVKRRLKSDVQIGCLLSGGLDSSLVAAIASRILAKSGKKLKTFCIGMDGSTDIAFSNKVAHHIDSEHTNIYFTPEEGLTVIPDVLKATETFDITTIRASVGQYLASKYIRQNTDVRVLLNGDGADECQMGYLYFYYAPSDEEAQNDSLRLINNIHLYDGLRVDRCVSYNGLEARVPFLDKEFVELYVNIHPHIKRPLIKKDRIEKHLIRKAFDVVFQDDPILPHEVLWRQKEAFSDGVSSRSKPWYVEVKKHIEEKVNETGLEKSWNHLPPPTKEALYYRYIFESLFGERATFVIPRYWLPSWVNTLEPSARTLNVYEDEKPF